MLVLALAVIAAVSDDWPQLLGPHRNGIYTGETVGWPSQFAWQKEVGSGFASPVIVGGRVILFHRKGDREIVEAFEAATGKTVWAFDSPTHYRDDFGFDNGPRATPTVAEGACSRSVRKGFCTRSI